MAKKRSQPKSRTHSRATRKPSLNGTDLGESHHSDADNTEAAAQDACDVARWDEGFMVGRFLSRLVYTASYSVSYGVVFPVMFIVHSVPTENALVRGLVDGGRAARDAVAALHDASFDPASHEAGSDAETAPA